MGTKNTRHYQQVHKQPYSHTSLFRMHGIFFQSLFYVVCSVGITVLVVFVSPFQQLMQSFIQLGYIGAGISGIFFVSIFSAAPAAILFLVLGQTYNSILLSVCGGIGAVIGDALLVLWMKRQGKEIGRTSLSRNSFSRSIVFLHHSRYRFFLTLLGACVVASPLPDELGLLLMGLRNVSRIQFAILTFTLNAMGIYLLLLVSQAFW